MNFGIVPCNVHKFATQKNKIKYRFFLILFCLTFCLNLKINIFLNTKLSIQLHSKQTVDSCVFR